MKPITAYILAVAEKSKQAQTKFIFGFECKKICINLHNGQVDKIFDNLESGLKNIPQRERITLLENKKP